MRREIDVDRSLDVPVGVVLDPAGRTCDADIVDENVEPAEPGLHVGHGAIDVSRRRRIARRAAKIGDLRNGVADRSVVDIGDVDLGPGAGKRCRDRAANPAGAGGHEHPQVAHDDGARRFPAGHGRFSQARVAARS